MKLPDYLAINVGGTVPLLVHGDFLLTENIAILGYLADLHPEANLLGDGTPRGRAEVMRWLGFLNSDVHKAFKPLFTPSRFLEDAAFAPALGERARVHVRHYLERLDAQLAGRDWLTDWAALHRRSVSVRGGPLGHRDGPGFARAGELGPFCHAPERRRRRTGGAGCRWFVAAVLHRSLEETLPQDIHTVGRNASQTRPAKFLVFLLKNQGSPVVLPAP